MGKTKSERDGNGQPTRPLDYETPETRRGEEVVALSPVARGFRWSCGLTIGVGIAAGVSDYEPLFFVAGALCLGAFITAVLSVRECARREGRGLMRLVPAMVVLSLFLAAWCAFPVVRRPIETANRMKCASNLSALGQVMMLYCNENRGQFPDRWEELLRTQQVPTFLMVCPSSSDTDAPGDSWQERLANLSSGGHCSYVYLAKGMNTTNVSSKTILAYEPLKNHKNQGMNVLFGDGIVVFEDKIQAKKMLDELSAGHNPPRAEKLN